MTPNSFTFAFCWIGYPEQRVRRLLSSRLCSELNHDEENRIRLNFVTVEYQIALL